jgi:hypothetical protein
MAPAIASPESRFLAFELEEPYILMQGRSILFGVLVRQADFFSAYSAAVLRELRVEGFEKL